MSFGSKGAPATFQRAGSCNIGNAGLCSSLLGGFSRCWIDHPEHLSAVLQWLREAGLTVKARKCQLGMKECVYLGYTYIS